MLIRCSTYVYANVNFQTDGPINEFSRLYPLLLFDEHFDHIFRDDVLLFNLNCGLAAGLDSGSQGGRFCGNKNRISIERVLNAYAVIFNNPLHRMNTISVNSKDIRRLTQPMR
jgi:hypothetical protein